MNRGHSRGTLLRMNVGQNSNWKLTLLLVVAFALRAWEPTRMSVEHFDEGVYASNLFADHLGYQYPDRQLYAPPLFPAMLEWALILSGAHPRAVMWVNVLLGTVLVAAVWWTTGELLRSVSEVECRGGEGETGRRGENCWRDLLLAQADVRERAALAAAALVAFSDFFIQYSRAALTDIPVCLWMTLAVGAGVRGLRSGQALWIGAATLLTALAWWTKYNGWLPLAILGGGIGGWVVCLRPSRQEWLPVAGRWGVIAFGAFLCWSPFLWSLQGTGGYAAVAANHAGYVVGWSGWWDSLTRQLAVDRHYAAAMTSCGLFLAMLLAETGFTWNAAPGTGLVRRLTVNWSAWLTALILAPFVQFIGLVPLLGLLSVVGVWGLLRSFGSRLEAWVPLAWLVGLTVATPLYRPYPRLLLPWLTIGMISAGIGLALLIARLQRFVKTSESEANLRQERLSWTKSALAPLFLFAVLVWLPRSSAWQDRTGLERAAATILETIEEDRHRQPASPLAGVDFVIYVLAEPGLYFHLARREDEFVTQPASSLGMLKPGETDPRVPAYLVLGGHAREELRTLEADPARAVKVARFPDLPSDLVLLDDVSPLDLPRLRDSHIELWRIGVPAGVDRMPGQPE